MTRYIQTIDHDRNIEREIADLIYARFGSGGNKHPELPNANRKNFLLVAKEIVELIDD